MFTALLIAILVIAGGATVVGGGLILASQRRRALGGGEEALALTAGDGALLERGLGDLRVGDVIQTDGRDFLVEGLVRYDEAGRQWLAGRVVDGRDVRWLVVALERTGAAATLYALEPDFEMSGYPPEVLEIGAVRYRFDKRGTATARIFGEVGPLGAAGDALDPASVHRCRWWLYRTAGDDSLLVEQWGDDYRVLRGRRVSDADLEMIPGS